MRSLSILLFSFLLASCATGTDLNVTPVSGLDADRYLGTWYEIARTDNKFERGLNNVTATYAMREDGGIKVVNRGCNAAKGEWEDATGKAYFNGPNDTVGKLKVSFFGPFYGDYIVFDLDVENYGHAYISGGSTQYLWLLSRTPQINTARKADFLQKSKDLGYDTDSLLWVEQNGTCG